MSTIDRAYLSINGNSYECDTISVSGDGKKEPRNVMSRNNRAKGHKRGNPQWDISCEFFADSDDDDFHKMMTDGTSVTVVIEYEGGSSESYTDGEIYSVKMDAGQGDGVKWSLEITCNDRVA